MLIDCDTCAVRDLHCADCVVTTLLGNSGSPVELDSAEQNAIGALAGGGLLPPLRLVTTAAPDAGVSRPVRRPDEAGSADPDTSGSMQAFA
jgi:hypothetical protein